MEQWSRELSDMALFVEVGRTGSFRLAASRLQVPASTLSRRIAAMEARLGVRLLLRTTRQVSVASGAHAYYEQCLRMVEAADHARHLLPGTRGGPGRVRVAMPVDLGVEVLGPIVAAFASGQPGMQVDMELSSRASDLWRDPVDLAFRIGKPLDDRVVARRLGDIAAGLYAAPALLRRHPPVTRPEQLSALPCVNLQTAVGAMPWAVGGLRWPSAPGPSALSANSVALVRALAEQGHGVALLPAHIAAIGVQARRLIQVLPEAATPAWPLYALTAGRVVPPRVSALLAYVRSALKHSPLDTRPLR